jgi:hypothetical protein
MKVGIDPLHLAAKAQGVIVTRPGHHFVALQAKLQRLLRDAIGRAVVDVRKRNSRAVDVGRIVLMKLLSAKLSRLITAGVKMWTQSGDQALQVVLGCLAVGFGAEGAIELALAQIIFQFERVPEPNAIAFRRLPVEPFGGEEIMERRGREFTRNGLICRITNADQVRAQLLTIFHGNKPPCLVVLDGPAHIASVLLPVKGRSRSDTRVIGGGQALQGTVALVESDAAVE